MRKNISLSGSMVKSQATSAKAHAGNGKPFNSLDPAALNKISTELRHKEMFENMFEWGKRRR